MPYFPIFQDISGKNVLIVGGGQVAARKAEKLLPFSPHLIVCSPAVCEEMQCLPVEMLWKPFEPADLGCSPVFVLAATNDPAVNRQVGELCRQRRLPVNIADDPAGSTFLFPSLVVQGELSVGISTGGSAPSGAKWLREQLESIIPENFGDILADLERQREAVKTLLPTQCRRSKVLKALFAASMAQKSPLTEAQRDEIIKTVGLE